MEIKGVSIDVDEIWVNISDVRNWKDILNANSPYEFHLVRTRKFQKNKHSEPEVNLVFNTEMFKRLQNQREYGIDWL